MSKKLKLTDREWREFCVGELFNMNIGYSIDGNKADRTGSIPYITRKESDNGVDGFIRDDERKMSVAFPVITIGNETAKPFVQVYPFFTGTKVNILSPKDKVDTWALLFVATSIEQHKSKYSYSYTINSTRLRKQLILLPAASDGTPDWAFMEAYMREVEEELLSEVRPKLEAQLLEHIISLGILGDREWKEFVFGDLFSITSTSSSIDKKRLSSNNGDNPYITRSENDNGIDSFVEEQLSYAMDEGNVITIGLDTQTVFYQSYPFYTGQNIQIIRHTKLNKHNALFIIRAIKILVQKFSWGSYGATLTRLRRGKLYLPIGMDGMPDWEFMSAFMKRVEQETLLPAIKYFKLNKCNQVLMGGGEISPYFMEDVVQIINGVRLTKADMTVGHRPFVGASESANGVTEFVGNTNTSLDSDVLGVNYNGSVGFSFYHPYEALFSDDVKRVRWKDETANNKYTLLYLSTAVAQQRGKYAYGYKFNAQRMKRQIIMLPSKVDGTPDYAYMEQTMRAMEYDALMTYLTSCVLSEG